MESVSCLIIDEYLLECVQILTGTHLQFSTFTVCWVIEIVQVRKVYPEKNVFERKGTLFCQERGTDFGRNEIGRVAVWQKKYAEASKIYHMSCRDNSCDLHRHLVLVNVSIAYSDPCRIVVNIAAFMCVNGKHVPGFV